MAVGIDLALLKEFKSGSDVQSYAADLASKIRLTQDVIEQNMKDRALRSKVFYDKDTKEPQIAVGSIVLLFNDTLKIGVTKISQELGRPIPGCIKV